MTLKFIVMELLKKCFAELLNYFTAILKTLKIAFSSVVMPRGRKIVLFVFTTVLAVILSLLCLQSCGTTRTIVRTSGKGSTNATISVTTNNPTSVSVETKLDSTRLLVNKSPHVR